MERKSSRSIRVLIIDDDPRVVEILFQALEKEGFEPEGAGSAGEGYVKYLTKEFQVIMVDEALYSINGLRLIRLIRLIDNRPTLLMISGVADLPTAVSALRIGADDYISKPFKLWDLRDRIVTSINRRAIVARKSDQAPPEVTNTIERSFLFETMQGTERKIIDHLRKLIPVIEKNVLGRERFAERARDIIQEAGKKLKVPEDKARLLGLAAELQMPGFGAQDPSKVKEALQTPEEWRYAWRSFALEGAELLEYMGPEAKKCSDLLKSAASMSEGPSRKEKGVLEQILWLGTTITAVFSWNVNLRDEKEIEKLLGVSFDPYVTMAFLQPPE